MDRPEQTSRRLKLRHLNVLLAVAKWGSMAKAAEHLSITQPVVSKAIADLEGILGVPLLDRRLRASSRHCMVAPCSSAVIPFSMSCARASARSNSSPILQLAN